MALRARKWVSRRSDASIENLTFRGHNLVAGIAITRRRAAAGFRSMRAVLGFSASTYTWSWDGAIQESVYGILRMEENAYNELI